MFEKSILDWSFILYRGINMLILTDNYILKNEYESRILRSNDKICVCQGSELKLLFFIIVQN